MAIEFKESKQGIKDASVSGLRLRIFPDGKRVEVSPYDLFGMYVVPEGEDPEEFVLRKGREFYEKRLADFDVQASKKPGEA